MQLRWYYYDKNLKQHISAYHEPGQYVCEVKGCGKTLQWKVSGTLLISIYRILLISFQIQSSFKAHMARHKEGPKERKVCTSRKTRIDKDKPKPKTAIAVLLSGHEVSSEENKEIIKSGMKMQVKERDCCQASG